MKHILERINSRGEQAETSANFKHRLIEIIQSTELKGKKNEKNPEYQRPMVYYQIYQHIHKGRHKRRRERKGQQEYVNNG